MSSSGIRQSSNKKRPQALSKRRSIVQIFEIGALVVFLIGMGLNKFIIMAAGALIGWVATIVAYHNFRETIVKIHPDRRDAMSIPKFTLYVSFTLASALSLMIILAEFI